MSIPNVKREFKLIVSALGLAVGAAAYADDQAARVVVGNSTDFVFVQDGSTFADAAALCATLAPNCTPLTNQWSTMLQTTFDARLATSSTLIAETSAITAVYNGAVIADPSTIFFLQGAGVSARVLVDCVPAYNCDASLDVGAPGGPTVANLMQPGEVYLDQVLHLTNTITDANSLITTAELFGGARAFNFFKVGTAGIKRQHDVVFQVKLNTQNLAASTNSLVSSAAALVGKRTMILSSIKADPRTR
jgi:hypothetical protein